MKQLFFLILIPLFCYSQKKIDLYENLNNNKVVTLSKVAKDVIYIPLETREECLLSNELQIIYTENFLSVGDLQNTKFYRFDNKGKFLNVLGHKGDGPEEFPSASFFFVDEALQKVYVISPQSKALLKYDYDGRFCNKISLKESPWMIEKFNENLVMYNNRFNRISKDLNVKELFFFDDSGNILKSVPTTIVDKEMDMLLFEFPFFYRFNDELYYKNPLLDTVFLINKRMELEPSYIINTGPQHKRKDDYKNRNNYLRQISIRNIYENDDFVFIIYAYQNEFRCLFVDKKTSEAVNAKDGYWGFTDDITNGPSLNPYWLSGSNQNILVSLLTSDDIKKQKDKFLNIKSVSMEWEEDNNPIVVIFVMR